MFLVGSNPTPSAPTSANRPTADVDAATLPPARRPAGRGAENGCVGSAPQGQVFLLPRLGILRQPVAACFSPPASNCDTRCVETPSTLEMSRPVSPSFLRRCATA